MSSICRGGFVENAWRKDLCSNCFRTREEHEGMTSGFYQQPSWTHQSTPSTPSVAIQVKSSIPSGPVPSNYGLPPTPTQIQPKTLSTSSRYESPSIGNGLNNISGRSSRYAQGGGPAAIGSRINALYSDRVPPPTTNRNSGPTTSSGGINVTVNGTSNTSKKYGHHHTNPPQPAIRTSIPGGGRVQTTNLPGGGVSVSVGRSSSYSSQLNTVGTVASVRSSSVGLYNNNNSGSNYGNSVSNNGMTNHHLHQQKRTAHSHHPPTTQYQQTSTSQKPSSSVPLLTQSRTHLQHNQHGKAQQLTTTSVTLTEKVRSRNMDVGDGEVNQVKMSPRHGGPFDPTNNISPTGKSKKGILRRDGQKRKMSVSFPQEVHAVIGYGGECNSSEDEDDEQVPFDPLDSSSIHEIMEKSATSPLEKELNRVTVKNTNFNSVKTNLLGYAPIEIGPIVGNTGGKSKPLVSVGTFDSRKEPLRVLRKVGNDPPSPLVGKITKVNPVSKATNLGKVKELSPSATEKPKTISTVGEIRRNGMTQNHRPGSDNRVPVQKGKGNETIQAKCDEIVEVEAQSREIYIHPIPLIQDSGITETQILEVAPTNPSPVPIGAKTVEIVNITNSSVSTNSSETVVSEKNLNDRLTFVSLPHDSLDPPRVIESELKFEPPITQFLSNELTYEEDSLEPDSGLDTNSNGQTRTSETSESDTEKSGSNSDSGNENDFLEKLKSRSGLFVSIDPDNAPTSKKLAKLSPDSVISSEMSSTSPVDSSGSNESIPQKVSEEESEACAIGQVHKLNNAPVPPTLKRAAPLPPSQPLPNPPHPYSMEDLYDDVHLSSTQSQQESADSVEDIEESIYDDCANVGEDRKGSYDFTDPEGLAPEFGGEGVPLKQYPGIEFLGIRRIDSESFLKEATPLPTEVSTPKPSPGKKERSGSESPKPKRRVNQFFSTIGKKAGAAFRSTGSQGQGGLDLSPLPQKSGSMKSGNFFAPYKRSMSTDEVSMTRTQELYATLTPTTLKVRGLTPVLNKLSKFDLKDPKDKEENSGEKKKTKFSTSIKKFLGFGAGKMELESEVSGNRQSPPRITESPPRNEPNANLGAKSNRIRPPPPPPRVHSLDTLTKCGTVSMKPARPPPPKVNQVAPSFVSVFAGLEDEEVLDDGSGHEMYSPPNKPRRKASICRANESGDNGGYTANYLETTYNHITSLNFETLKLIASQPPAKIKRASNQLLKMNKSPLRWSQFYVTDVETLAYGQGFAFFSAFWEDEPCVILLQESLSCGLAPLQFDCIEMSASFEDVVQPQFVPWESSDFVNTGNGVRVYISVLAACTVQRLPDYVNNGSISPSRKFYALLQAMDFWGKEEMSNLVVFHKIPSLNETVEEPSTTGANKSKSSPSPNFGLVYVVGTRIKTGSNNLLSYYPARDAFQEQIQELLLESTTSLLVDNDKEILQRRLAGNTTEEVEAQLRLFLQLKLFGPRSGDLDKILRYRSERQVTQWMDKERAFCMNDALKRSLERNSEPMSPLRKSFVEFLMISDNCAKTILDFIVDLYPE